MAFSAALAHHNYYNIIIDINHDMHNYTQTMIIITVTDCMGGTRSYRREILFNRNTVY